MSIYDRYAGFVYSISTGSKRLKMLVMPLAASLFFGLTVLFVLASFLIDRLFGLPCFDPAPWSLGLSVFLFIAGGVISSLPSIAFFRARGTPVPFNPPPKLITTGLYAHTRNPMMPGLFLIMLGLGIFFRSLSLIFIFTPLFILLNVLYIKTVEEKELEKKFGEEYVAYRKRVPLFIPRLRKRK